MLSDNAIEINNLSKYYPSFNKPIERLKQLLFVSDNDKSYVNDFCAVNDLSLTIKKGEVVAVLGSNGSGKSTLLQMICGTLNPTLGNIKVNGRVAALLELGAGFNLEFTGRENIILNGSILGLSKHEINDRMSDIINFSELEEYIDQPVKSYSSGMFVRLAFSVAVNVYPDILIIDEALSVGDAKFQAKCINKIEQIISKGTTLLFVSHDVTAVRTICNRAIWLNKGDLIMDGDVFNVSGKYMEYMLDDKDRNINTFVKEEVFTNNQDSLSDKQSKSQLLPTKDDQVKLVNNAAAHWGALKGIVKRVQLLDSNGKEIYLYENDSVINISVDYLLDDEVSDKKVQVAFSIKNLKGIDLIVGTHVVKGNVKGKILNTTFSMKNKLVPNDYILVVAIEDVGNKEPHYYEYIEGAGYFKSTSRNKLHGIFTPEIKIETKELT